MAELTNEDSTLYGWVFCEGSCILHGVMSFKYQRHRELFRIAVGEILARFTDIDGWAVYEIAALLALYEEKYEVRGWTISYLEAKLYTHVNMDVHKQQLIHNCAEHIFAQRNAENYCPRAAAREWLDAHPG